MNTVSPLFEVVFVFALAAAALPDASVPLAADDDPPEELDEPQPVNAKHRAATKASSAMPVNDFLTLLFIGASSFSFAYLSVMLSFTVVLLFVDRLLSPPFLPSDKQ